MPHPHVLRVALERPALDPHVGVADGRLGEAEPGAPDALVLPEPTVLGVAERAMRDQQLARREGAGIALIDGGPGAEEGDLKAERSRPLRWRASR